MDDIISGNLDEQEDPVKRGWFMGHFISEKSFFHNKDFEIRCANHKKGDKKENTVANIKSKSISILINGKCVIRFPQQNKEIILSKQGDFVFWNSKVYHNSEVLEDSTILTIRWPSIPDDVISLEN